MIVVVWLPVLVLFAMFVLEVGNWYEHKRHLQMQADAGAFAGGGLFNGCFGDASAAGLAIENEARKYAGDPTQLVRFNDQVGGSNQGSVTARINRKTYEVGGPPPVGIHLLMGANAKEKIANVILNLERGVIAPTEMICIARQA